MASPIGNYFSGVAAKNLYHSSPLVSSENPFSGSRNELGVGAFCFAGEGQVNGEPPTKYYTNQNGYMEKVERTFDMFA